MATLVETAYYNYLSQVPGEMTIGEFRNLLITDDSFNNEWSNGSTRVLTFDERYALAESIESVRIAKVQKYGEAYVSLALDGYNIPRRVVIE